MPDWSYHPLLRPIGIALHGDRTRSLTVQRMATLGSRAVGRWVIRFLGHSAPAPQLAFTKAGVHFPSRVLLDASIDPAGSARSAFAQLGYGAIEVDAPVDSAHTHNAVALVERYGSDRPASRAAIVRCSLDQLAAATTRSTSPVVVDIPPDTTPQQLRSLQDAGAAGFVISTDTYDRSVIDAVMRIRDELGPEVLVMAGGYVAGPQQGAELLEAGADLTIVGEGLAVAGPGIAKRIDELFLARAVDRPPGASRSWISGTLFGLGLMFAAFIATYLALTSVILDYDERFAGTSRTQLLEINPHLLDFMSHDRLSYAGATLSLAILYTALAALGMRKREAWAHHAFVTSGIAGFSTFLLFFAYGYFDPGNAAVALVLLPFFLFAAVRHSEFVHHGNGSDLENDSIWRRALVGQLLLVTMSIGLIIGGSIICVVGSTDVFVISDLDFLQTTAHHIEQANSRLLPLIAHDRVSFGGGIVCNGLAALLMCLWGFRRGESWVWWSLAIAGTCNLAFTLYAHFGHGYVEFGHLFPVFLGATFFYTGLLLSYRFLAGRR